MVIRRSEPSAPRRCVFCDDTSRLAPIDSGCGSRMRRRSSWTTVLLPTPTGPVTTATGPWGSSACHPIRAATSPPPAAASTSYSAQPRGRGHGREEDDRRQHNDKPRRPENRACLRDGKARLAGACDLAHGHLTQNDGKQGSQEGQRDKAQDAKDETCERGRVEVGSVLHGQIVRAGR